ncbi:uncharacterized protein LOC135037868 isoform X2 [Pseudophryne corroboree]|uniref:uncharacterized protein LOC135037868 isoform X2 n=1 Tax=Pseudophryne corroboree TaxID=495146 RepID=UPI0030817AB8
MIGRRSRRVRRQTPPIVTFGLEMDFAASFHRNQKRYQEQMIDIFTKYDLPFEDDLVVDIEVLTHEKLNGSRAPKTKKLVENPESSLPLDWTLIEGSSCDSLIEIHDTTPLFRDKLLDDDDDGIEDSIIGGKIGNDLALHKDEHSTRKMCSTLIHSPARGEYSDNDNRELPSQEYPESNRKLMLGKKTGKSTYKSKSGSSEPILYISSSDTETEAVDRPQAYDCTFLLKRDLNKSSSVASKETGLLQGSIPLHIATPTLDKTFTWNNKSNKMQSPEKTFKGNVNDRKVSLNKPCMLIEGNKSTSPGKTLLDNESNRTISVNNKGSNNSRSLDETYVYNMDKMTLSPGKTFANQQQQKIDEVTFSYCKEYIAQNTKGASSETRRRSIYSALPIVGSPGKSYSKSNCSLNNENITLGKTDQSDLDSDERYSCKEHVKQSPRLTFPLTRKTSFSDISSPGRTSKANCSMNNRSVSIMKTPSKNNRTICPTKTFTTTTPIQITKLTNTENRRHSFSALPAVHSPGVGHFKSNEHFESLYKKLVLDGASKPKTRLSETVSSLVNSPESPRVKRPACEDLSLSLLKKKKSIDETFIISPSNQKVNSGGKSTLSSKEINFGSPVPHTDVNSVLQSRLSFNSPVSPNLLSQRVNSESTKMCNSPQMGQRTNSSVYKKLCFK